MAVGTLQVGAPVALTSSGNVAGAGTALSGAQASSTDPNSAAVLLGFFSSVASGTLVLNNIAAGGGAGSTTYLPSTTFTNVGWYPLPMTIPSGGLYATIGGSGKFTFIIAE